jgi:hypothetical protein
MRRTACCAVSSVILAAAVAGCSGAGAPTTPSDPAASCAAANPGAQVSPCLMFTGAITATATSRIGAVPAQTASSIVAGPAPFTTQCVIAGAGSGAMWTAQFTMATPDNKWMITISNVQGSGNPTPGHHVLIGVAYPGQPPAGALTVGVESRKPILASLTSAQAAAYVYTPGAKTYDVTLDPSLMSGSLDVTLAPIETGNPKLTISGNWSCA